MLKKKEKKSPLTAFDIYMGAAERSGRTVKTKNK